MAGFGDLLAGLVMGGSQVVGERRQEKRLAQERSLEPKRQVGQLALQALVEGKAHPKQAMPLVNDYVRSFEPRESVGGLAGFLGEQEMPQTPAIDMLLGPDGTWSGPGAPFMDPTEQFQRESDWLIGRQIQGDQLSLKAWRDSLPEQIATLTQLGISPDVARNVLLSQKFGENVLGIKGTAIDFWDPVARQVFRGQRDPMMGGVVNLATGNVVEAARAVTIDERTNWQTGTTSYIDRNNGEVLFEVKGTVPPPFPSPYFNTMMGGMYSVNPLNNQPSYTPIPGAPPGAPQLNPEFETAKFKLSQIDAAIDRVLGMERSSDIYTDMDQTQMGMRLQALQDATARQWGFNTYQEAVTQAAGQPARVTPGGGDGAVASPGGVVRVQPPPLADGTLPPIRLIPQQFVQQAIAAGGKVVP